MIDFILSLPTWVLVVGGLAILGTCAKGMEQTALIESAGHTKFGQD